MSAITVSLTEEQLRRLEELAARLKLSPEDLVRASIGDLLARPNDEFRETVKRVLEKNAELYRRLA